MAGALLRARGSAKVALSNRTLSAVDIELGVSASANATFQLNNDGTAAAVITGNSSTPAAGTTAYTGEWLRSGVASDYEAVVAVTAGALNSGAAGTFSLATSRSFGVNTSRSTLGTNTVTATITIQIRKTGTTDVLASATISLSAQAQFDN